MRDVRDDAHDQIPAGGQRGPYQALQRQLLERAEVAPDVVFDYDADGRIVGIGLLDAKAQLPGDALTKAA